MLLTCCKLTNCLPKEGRGTKWQGGFETGKKDENEGNDREALALDIAY